MYKQTKLFNTFLYYLNLTGKKQEKGDEIITIVSLCNKQTEIDIYGVIGGGN